MSLQPASRKMVSALECDYAINGPKHLIDRSCFPEIRFATKLGRYLSPLVLLFFDYLSIMVGLLSSIYVRNLLIPNQLISVSQFSKYIFLAIPAIYISLMAFEGLYSKRPRFWQKAECLFKVAFFATVFTIGLLFFEHSANNISRIFVGLSVCSCFVFLLVSRYLTKRLLAKLGLWQKPVLLVGAGKTAELIAAAFEEEPNMGYQIVGVVEDNYLRPLTQKYPLLGKFADVEAIVNVNRIDDVIIATPGIEREQLLDLVYRIQPYAHNISVVPDLFGMPVNNINIDTLFNQKTVMLKISNNLLQPWNRFCKRFFDILVCSVALLFIWPLFVTIGLLIRLGSKETVVFAHKRVGRNGKTFPCYKFRTMVSDAEKVLEEYLAQNPEFREEWEREFKLKDDPRITKIGQFLRKTSLDELPQLFNILKGEMSLVGPRPIVTKEVSKYKEYINDYYMVRPGLTGLWQVSGRNDIDYDSRVKLDSWYVRNWTFWMDVVMIVKTIRVVLSRTGAY